MRNSWCTNLARLLCGLSMGVMVGQAAAQVGSAELSDESSISLITVLPGNAVYSLFGHSAVRVRDPELGIDYSFSYGTFHFNDPMFVPKFIRGDLEYFLSVSHFDNALRLYRDVERRPMVEQRLALDLDQRRRLFRFLQDNARTENRYYRYDFLFDNCSTRIRDALETVLGENLAFAAEDSSIMSFRGLLAPYLRGRSALRLGIDLLLGSRVDRSASVRETTFLPDYLSSSFDSALLRGPAGIERPLVSRRDTILSFPAYRRAARESHLTGYILAVVCFFICVATLVEARRGAPNEWIDTVLFGLVGLLGCFLLFMWFGTSHSVTAGNWNLIWVWPTHIVYAGLLARKGLTRLVVAYAGLSAGCMVVLLALWSFIPQDLPEPALAVVLVVAVRGTWLTLYDSRRKAGDPEIAGP